MPVAHPPTDLVSIREAARRLGLASDNAVRKRIRARRLATYGDPPRVSLAEVQAEFARTSPTQVMAGNSRAVLPDGATEKSAPPTEPGTGSGEDDARTEKRVGNDLLQKTNAVYKAKQARLLDLKIQAAEGSLVDLQFATHRVYELARAERDSWQSWPDTAAGEMAADLETELRKQYPELTLDRRFLHEVLSRHVRAHLEALALPQVDLRPAEG